MSEQWFLAITKQGAEKRAKMELENQQFGTYLPFCIAEWTWKPRIRPFLGGYIFVSVDLDDRNTRWRAVYSTYGVRTVLASGDKPQIVPAWVIQEIMAREVDGLVRLPPKEECKFQNGDKVRVAGSPLDAVFDEPIDHRRAHVFISILGKIHRKPVDLKRLSAANAVGVSLA